MENEQLFDEEFIIYLTIDNSAEEVEAKVNDPNKTIRDQINSIVQACNLPKMDGGNNPLQYLLGQVDESGEKKILEFEDENGREQCLLDYGIRPGDHLHLVVIPIAG